MAYTDSTSSEDRRGMRVFDGPRFDRNIPGRTVADVPAREIAALRYHAYRWRTTFAPRLTIRTPESPEAIRDAAVRHQIEKRQRINGWYDAVTGEVNVYLPNIALDRHPHARLEMVLFHEVVAHHGLRALLGPAGYDALCGRVFDSLRPQDRARWAAKVGGSPDEPETRLMAGAEYIAHVAERMAVDGSFMSDTTSSEWKAVMEHLRGTEPHLVRGSGKDATVLYDNVVTQVLGMAAHEMATQARYQEPEMSREEISEAMDRQLDALKPMHDNIVKRDLNMTFKLGRLSSTVLNSSSSVMNLPLEMRSSALWGSWWDDKQSEGRHPFSLDEIKGFVNRLAEPLAIFESKQEDKGDSVIAVLDLPGRDNRGRDSMFVAVLTPKVNRDGFSVMNIDSIYPKCSRDIMRWMSQRRNVRNVEGELIRDSEGRYVTHTLLRYASDRFLNEWFPKAEKAERDRLTAAVERERKFKPSGEQLVNPTELTGGLASLEKEAERFESEILTATKIASFLDKNKFPEDNIRFFSREDGLLTVSAYDGDIAPEKDVVFVFGSNPEGRHGAGAARVAAERFGAVGGVGEGLTGNAYALPTKDLAQSRTKGLYSPSDSRWKEMTAAVLKHYENASYDEIMTDNPYPRSISPERIVDSIVEMYRTAESNPDKVFRVAYRNGRDEFSLNGYCGGEMAAMFLQAGREYGIIPSNVEFSREWIRQGLMTESAVVRQQEQSARTVTLAGRTFDADELAQAVNRMRVTVFQEPWGGTGRVYKLSPSQDYALDSESRIQDMINAMGYVSAGDGRRALTEATGLTPVEIYLNMLQGNACDVSDAGRKVIWLDSRGQAVKPVRLDASSLALWAETVSEQNMKSEKTNDMTTERKDGFLAPDGAPSSLSPALYDHVHSAAFIARHGDWTAPGYDGGLVLDAHGEPKVLWHGSAKKFDAFDLSHAGDNTGITEYTDRTTGETVRSDSEKALFFTDSRQQAATYAFLGWTNTLAGTRSDVERMMEALRTLKAPAGFRERIAALKAFSPALAAILAPVDEKAERPVGSLSREKREEIWSALRDYRNDVLDQGHGLGFSTSVGSPISNMMHNTTRQMEYFEYFRDNFDRIRRNDLTVATEDFGGEDRSRYTFEHYSVSFFDAATKFQDGVHVFVDGDGALPRIVVRTPDGSRMYADEMTDAQAESLMEQIRGGLDRMAEHVNAQMEQGGFIEHTHLYPVFLTMRNPLEHDYHYSPFPDKYLPDGSTPTALVAARQNARAHAEGRDGVIYRNVVDPFAADTYGVFSAEQVEMIDSSLLRAEEMDLRLQGVGKRNEEEINKQNNHIMETEKKTEEINFRSVEQRAEKLIKATPEERRAEGYYTSKEIKELNIPKEQVKGLLNNFSIEGVWPNLEYVRDWIDVIDSSSASLPKCQSVGHVVVHENASLDLPQCQCVEDVFVKKNASLSLPQCQSVKGEVYVEKDAFLDLSQCKSAGFVAVYDNASLSLPQCQSVDRVVVLENASLDLSQCKSFIWEVIVRKNASLDLSQCKGVSRVTVERNAFLDLSSCKTISGEKDITPLAKIKLYDEKKDEKNAGVTLTESSAWQYRDRTRENARSADVTLAFAMDFSTAGERATRTDAGDRYIAVDMRKGIDIDAIASRIAEMARGRGFDPAHLSINVAGNGIYTLAGEGVTQRDADLAVTRTLALLEGRGGIHIDAVRSGGQTGIDEAGIQAARALGIPATVLAPKGWRMRVADSAAPDGYRDVSGREAFAARFESDVTYLTEAVRELSASQEYNNNINDMETEKKIKEEPAVHPAQAPKPSAQIFTMLDRTPAQMEAITEAVVPEGFTAIGASAFAGCVNMTAVTLPGSLTSIRPRAFGGCSSLPSLTLPPSLRAIGGGAFAGCSALRSISIPDSVISIGEGAFDGCTSLESVSMTSDTYYRLRGSLPSDLPVVLNDIDAGVSVGVRSEDADETAQEGVKAAPASWGRILHSDAVYMKECVESNMRDTDTTLLIVTQSGADEAGRVARATAGRYIPVFIGGGQTDGAVASEEEIARMASGVADELFHQADIYGFNQFDIRLNVAGSTAARLERDGISQRMTDRFVTRLLSVLGGDDRVHVGLIRTAGQTGAEEAGIQAARALGLSWEVNATRNWSMRVPSASDPRGFTDMHDEDLFRERFDRPVDGLDVPVGRTYEINAATGLNAALSDGAERPVTVRGTRYGSVAEAYRSIAGLLSNETERETMMRVITTASFRDNPEALQQLLSTAGYALTDTGHEGADRALYENALDAARNALMQEEKTPGIDRYRALASELARSVISEDGQADMEAFGCKVLRELGEPDMTLLRRLAADEVLRTAPDVFEAGRMRFYGAYLDTYIGTNNMSRAHDTLRVETVRAALQTNDTSVLPLAVRRALSEDAASIRDRILDNPEWDDAQRARYAAVLDIWTGIAERRAPVPAFKDDEIADLEKAPEAPKEETPKEETPQEPAPAPEKKAVPEGRGRIYAIGLGRRTKEDFYSHLPKSAARFIDMRSWTVNKDNPHFNGAALRDGLRQLNASAQYENVKVLSGRTTEPAYLNDDKSVNYDKYAARADYAAAIADIESALDHGENIVLLDYSANPTKNAAALLVGQSLARDGYGLLHIDKTRNDTYRMRPQEEVISAALGFREIIGGDHTSIHFSSNGSFTKDEGVRLGQRIPPVERGMETVIEGNWNHGRPVTFEPSGSDDRDRVNEENVDAADFTLVLMTSRPSRHEFHTLEYAGKADAMRVSIPDDRERLLDPDYAARVASRISEKLAWAVLQGTRELDTDNIRLHIQGPDEPHVEMRRVEGAVSEDELSGKEQKFLVQTGMKLDDMAPISQDDVNAFVTSLLSELSAKITQSQQNPEFNEFYHPIRIGTVITSGESGVGEAAMLAGQACGMDVLVHHTKKSKLTFNDETLNGLQASAVAALQNRAHLGLHGRMTTEDVTARMREHDASMIEDAQVVGLQKEHIVVLDLLGFGNHDILDLVGMADRNDVVINTPEDMYGFLQNCAADGIRGAEKVTLADVREQFAQAAALIEEARAKGLSYTTIVSADYPSALRNIRRYPETISETEVVVHDGVASTETHEVTVYNGAPALQWYRGDLSVFDGPSLSLLGGGDWSDTAALSMARDVASKAVAAGALIIVSSLEGPQGEAARQAVRDGGRVAYISSEPVTSGVQNDIVDEITRSGGVVASENSHRKKKDDRSQGRDRRRGNAMSTALGAAALILDDMEKMSPAVVGELSALTAAPVVIGVTRAVHALRERAKKREKRVPVAERTITNDREPGVTVDLDGTGMPKLLQAAGTGAGVTEPSRTLPPSAEPEFADLGDVELHPETRKFRMATCGDRTVFFIEKNYVDIINSLRQQYGPDVEIEDPSRMKAVLSEMRTGAADYGHGKVMLHEDGGAATGVQLPKPEVETVYFDHGVLYDRVSVPDTDGKFRMLPKEVREKEQAIFDELRDSVLETQRRALSMAQMEGLPPMRFANAFYPVVGRNSIELYKGDTLQGRIYMAENGRLRKQYIRGSVLRTSIANRVTDAEGNVLSRNLPDEWNVDVNSVRALAREMNDWLTSASPDESDTYALASREERDEIDKEVETGYRKVARSNIALMQDDMHEAVTKGLMPGGQEADMDRTRAMGLLYVQGEALRQELTAASGELSVAQARLLDVTDRRNESIYGNMQGVDREDIEREYNECVEKVTELTGRVNDLEKRSGLCLEAAGRVATAGRVTLSGEATGREKEMTLFAEGYRFTVPNVNLTAAQKEAAAQALVDLRMQADKRALHQEGFLTNLRTAVPVSEKKAQTQSQSQTQEKGQAVNFGRTPDKDPRVALESEVVSRAKNGERIVKRDGKYAVADKALNIRSKFYDEIKPFAGAFAIAKDERGKCNLLDKNGKELWGMWMDAVEGPSEGFYTYRLNWKGEDYYNAVNAETGELAFQRVRPYIGQMHDGWFVVQAGAQDGEHNKGKYNWMNSRGDCLLSEWADKCEDFKDGAGLHTSNGITCVIDNNGTPLGVIKVEGESGLADDRTVSQDAAASVTQQKLTK